MPAPKLRLWARLIQSGCHDYDNPNPNPNIPLITGSPATASKPKKDNVVDALTSAATAVVKLLQPKQVSSSPSTPNTKSTGQSTYVSPMKLMQLR